MPNSLIPSLHGNFLVIDKLGVIITGEPNIGKSELSLALLDRKHQLVCDDVVELKKQQEKLIGVCPALTRHYLMISGIGVLDIQKLFGPQSICREHPIDLIIHLVKLEKMPAIEDPLHPLYESLTLMNITIPKILFPAQVGKSLPLLVETLVRNHHLKISGDDAGEKFNRHYYDARKQ